VNVNTDSAFLLLPLRSGQICFCCGLSLISAPALMTVPGCWGTFPPHSAAV